GLVQQRKSEVFQVHDLELGVIALDRDVIDPAGYGLPPAAGARAADDDAYLEHGSFPFVGVDGGGSLIGKPGQRRPGRIRDMAAPAAVRASIQVRAAVKPLVWRMTAISAVPVAAPIRWTTLPVLVASGISAGRSVR